MSIPVDRTYQTHGDNSNVSFLLTYQSHRWIRQHRNRQNLYRQQVPTEVTVQADIEIARLPRRIEGGNASTSQVNTSHRDLSFANFGEARWVVSAPDVSHQQPSTIIPGPRQRCHRPYSSLLSARYKRHRHREGFPACLGDKTVRRQLSAVNIRDWCCAIEYSSMVNTIQASTFKAIDAEPVLGPAP